MLSFEQMNIYDVLVLSGAGENRIVWLPSAQKVGGGNRRVLGCCRCPSAAPDLPPWLIGL